MEESRSCTCGGGNTRCCFCFGTGVITRRPVQYFRPPRRPPDLSTLIVKFGPAKAAQAMQAQLAARVVQCDRCRFRGQPEELQIHQEKAHPDGVTASSLLRAIKNVRNVHRNDIGRLRRLPDERFGNVTRVQIEKSATSAARNQAISKGLIKPAKARPLSPTFPRRALQVKLAPASSATAKLVKAEWVACSFCKKPVKAKNMRRHKRKCLPPVFYQKKSIVDDRILSAPKRETPSDSEFVENSATLESTDHREAHRYMGFFARENGRFGSHPLHDPFGDESEP